MRNASAGLKALLNTGVQFVICDLLTIVPLVGSIVRITSAQQNVTILSQYDNASHTFLAGGDAATVPSFRRGATKIVIGLETDSLDVTLLSKSTHVFQNALSWPAAARAGLLDGATVVLERAFLPSFADTSNGTLINFWGRISGVQPTRNSVHATVESELALLGIGMPRNVYQPKCLHTLYDAGCTLVRATYVVAGTVAAGSTASAIKTGLVQADGYFNLGVITFTSGALINVSASIKAYVLANGLVTPVAALFVAPQTGDTFNIVPGCDKTQATCNTKFTNLTHFRGYPYVPVPESAG